MNFIRIVSYKVKILLSNRILLVFLIILPIITAYISGYSSKIEQLKIVPIAIIDEDSSVTSKLVIERLLKNEELKVFSTNRAQGQNFLKNSQIESLFILEKGFEDKVKQLPIGGIIKFAAHRDSPNTEFVKEIIAGQVNRIFSTYYTFEAIKGSYKNKGIAPGSELFENVNKTIEGYWNPPLMTYDFSWRDTNDITKKVAEDKSNLSPNNTYHGISLLFIMLFVMFGSTWITEERNSHILLRMHCIRKAFLINFLANKSALLICGLGLQIIITILIRVIFELNVINDIKSVAIYFLYTSFAVSLGILLGSLIKSTLTLQSIAAPLTFLLSFVGGCFFNLSELSQRAAQMTLLTPQGWALMGLNSNFYLAASVLAIGTCLITFSSYLVLNFNRLN